MLQLLLLLLLGGKFLVEKGEEGGVRRRHCQGWGFKGGGKGCEKASD